VKENSPEVTWIDPLYDLRSCLEQLEQVSVCSPTFSFAEDNTFVHTQSSPAVMQKWLKPL
jgi:hypothetical protein